jgi:hypothetical protein
MTRFKLTAEELFKDYQSLPKKEKEAFNNLMESQSPIPGWQKDLVYKRLKAIESDPKRTVPKEEAFQKLGWK